MCRDIWSNSMTPGRVALACMFKEAGLRSPRTQLTKVQIEISVQGRHTEANFTCAFLNMGRSFIQYHLWPTDLDLEVWHLIVLNTFIAIFRRQTIWLLRNTEYSNIQLSGWRKVPIGVYTPIGVQYPDRGIISWSFSSQKVEIFYRFQKINCRSHQNTKNEVTFV